MFGRHKRVPVRTGPVHHRAPLSREVRAAVWDRCGGRCVYCGRAMNPFRDFTVDHIVPVHRGGTDDLSNLAGSCRSCNASKGTRSAAEFIRHGRRPPQSHRRRHGVWGLLFGR